MFIKCPHCGESLTISKAVDITSTKSVGDASSGFSSGLVKAISESIDTKVEEKLDKNIDKVISSLSSLNSLANGSFSKKDDGLASGWSGSMATALRAKNKLESGGDISKDTSDVSDKSMIAKRVQNLLHGALNRKD